MIDIWFSLHRGYDIISSTQILLLTENYPLFWLQSISTCNYNSTFLGDYFLLIF